MPDQLSLVIEHLAEGRAVHLTGADARALWDEITASLT